VPGGRTLHKEAEADALNKSPNKKLSRYNHGDF
jgi:hypothetical protein